LRLRRKAFAPLLAGRSKFFSLGNLGCCNCSGSTNETITVEGCTTIKYPGVTVSVYTASGGTLIDSQTTDGSGVAHLTLPTVPGTYWVTITYISSRFNAFVQSRSLTGTDTIGLAPATGYTCDSGCCLYPITNSITLTDSEYGTFTLTYDITSLSWISGPQVANYPGCTGCPPSPSNFVLYS
jgi:hypothetical protein